MLNYSKASTVKEQTRKTLIAKLHICCKQYVPYAGQYCGKCGAKMDGGIENDI